MDRRTGEDNVEAIWGELKEGLEISYGSMWNVKDK